VSTEEQERSEDKLSSDEELILHAGIVSRVERDEAFKLAMYARRVRALEDLLVAYRTSRLPSERIHVELEKTRRHIDSNGQWRDRD